MLLSRVLIPPRRAALLNLSVVACLSVSAAASSAAQVSPTTAAPTAAATPLYDIISVKPNKTGNGSMRISAYPTTFLGDNVTLKWLVSSAFGVRSEQISGLPSWAESQHWDISAKIVDPDPALKDRKQTREQSKAEFQAKLQAMLRDRFQMKWHLDTVIAPIFELVVAKGGSKLKPATKAEEGHGSVSISSKGLKAIAFPMQGLTEFLAGVTERNVEDKTSLTGLFDVELKWSNEDESATGTDNGAADRPPDIYTAVEEQLGLRLVPGKGPVKSVVVDSVEQPTPD